MTHEEGVQFPGRNAPAPAIAAPRAYFRRFLGGGAMARACAATSALRNVASSTAFRSQRVAPMRPHPPDTGANASGAMAT